jgi:hypothetical protein
VKTTLAFSSEQRAALDANGTIIPTKKSVKFVSFPPFLLPLFVSSYNSSNYCISSFLPSIRGQPMRLPDTVYRDSCRTLNCPLVTDKRTGSHCSTDTLLTAKNTSDSYFVTQLRKKEPNPPSTSDNLPSLWNLASARSLCPIHDLAMEKHRNPPEVTRICTFSRYWP